MLPNVFVKDSKGGVLHPQLYTDCILLSSADFETTEPGSHYFLF